MSLYLIFRKLNVFHSFYPSNPKNCISVNLILFGTLLDVVNNVPLLTEIVNLEISGLASNLFLRKVRSHVADLCN